MTKNQIKKVQEYFKKKLLNGEYDVVSKREHVWVVTIDHDYKFPIFISTHNTASQFNTVNNESFMNLQLTGEEEDRLSSLMFEQYSVWDKEVLRKERLAKYEELKAEFETAQ